MSTKHQFALGLAIAVLGGLIVEIVKGFPILRWSGTAVVSSARWLTAGIGVQRWTVIVFWGMAAVLAALGVKRLRRPSDPLWLSYRTDSFLGVKWSWDYFGHAIADGTVVPYCPHCSCRMVFANASNFTAAPKTQVLCEECGYSQTFEGHPSDVRSRIGRLIERSVNTGEWTQAVARQLGSGTA